MACATACLRGKQCRGVATSTASAKQWHTLVLVHAQLEVRTALALCRPRGTVVLKTTTNDPRPLNLTPLVLREMTLVGSRCGPFEAALRWLVDHPDLPLERLVTARYPLRRAVEAFARAAKSEALKVIVEMGAD